RIKALIRWYKVYKRYIPSRWRRFFFFMKYRRTYPLYEKYETFKHDLKKVLVKLKANGFPLAIVSNTSEARLNFFRNKLDLDKYFSIYITRDDTPFRKPNPYPILLALKHIKMEYKVPIIKENVYFVGDLPTDIDTAKNAGINSIALLSGHGVKGDLEKSKPTFIIQDIKTILEIEPFKKFILD
ncbi:MAG: HAD family hydrolase, partial [Candidatus Hodarchaeota archaeon]